jgi:hypothetical protein
LNSTQKSRRNKPRYVADHTTSDSNEERPAIGSRAAKRTRDLFHAAKILCRFGVIEEVNRLLF